MRPRSDAPTRRRWLVEVEQAPGPGVDLERDVHGGVIGRRARTGSLWLGFDRAGLVDSDDGRGRRVPVLVALPTSTFVGCHLEVELTGAFQRASGPILVAAIDGGPRPQPGLALVAANGDVGTWLDDQAAERIARDGRRRDRERRSHARIGGGRAWSAAGALPPEVARFATPHSLSEYRLSTLPLRFVRGLEGLLDDDERLLYWVERPIADTTVFDRLRGSTDRRAALLALTDRQLLWMVDHAQPDRYLSDWGVDVKLVPVERLLDVGCQHRGSVAALTTTTRAGTRTHELPLELAAEVGIMRDLLARFTPSGAGNLPRRCYRLDPVDFDAGAADHFGQAAEAQRLYVRAARGGEVLGFCYSPKRPGHGQESAAVVRRTAIEVITLDAVRQVALARVPEISLTLSPLIGRLGAGPGIDFTYPASLVESGAALVRTARRALALAR